MDATSIQDIVYWSDQYKVPAWIGLCIAWAETSINPGEVGDNGTSFGLFQLHTPDGQGDVYTQYGSSPTVLLSPSLNAKIGLAPIAQAYRDMAPYKLSGFGLLMAVADHSGHPDDIGYMPAYYYDRLQLAYAEAQKENWFAIGADVAPTSVGVDPYTTHAHQTSGGSGGSEGGSGVVVYPGHPVCDATLGTYVGTGAAAGVQEGLYVFAKTTGGVTVKTVVNQDCQVLGQFNHGVPPKIVTTKTVPQSIVQTLSSPNNLALLALGLGLGLAGFYYLEHQHGIRLVPTRRGASQ